MVLVVLHLEYTHVPYTDQLVVASTANLLPVHLIHTKQLLWEPGEDTESQNQPPELCGQSLYDETHTGSVTGFWH